MRPGFAGAVLVVAFLVGACAPRSRPAQSAAPVADTTDISTLAAVEGRDYRVFTGDGGPASLAEILDALGGVDVVLLGEEHGDPLTHRLELEILRQAFVDYARPTGGAVPPGHGVRPHPAGGGRPVILSLEMFERDVQMVLDEYLSGLITEEHFLASSRPWSNYRTDYRPMVEFAKAHGVPILASNAPRRYVNRASRLGRDSLRALSPEALATLAPLPYPEPSGRYQARFDSVMGGGEDHTSASLLDGQSLWDATMAYSIAGLLQDGAHDLVVHLAGSFHVECGTGIPEFLRHYSPGARALTVTFRPTDGPPAFDAAQHAGLADYVVVTVNRADNDPHGT